MIKTEITGVHTEVDVKLRKYVTKKIGGLEKYLSRHVRESAHAEVILREEKKGDQKYTAEVTVYLPADVINVKESTLNMYAAVDIVETKLKNQLRKYKDTHTNPRFYRRLVTKLKRSAAI